MLKELNTEEAPEQGQWLSAFWKGEADLLTSCWRRPAALCLNGFVCGGHRFPPALPVSTLVPVQQLPSELVAQHFAK